MLSEWEGFAPPGVADDDGFPTPPPATSFHFLTDGQEEMSKMPFFFEFIHSYFKSTPLIV